MLLDYLQHAKAQIHCNRLYPDLGEMASRYAELLTLQQGKTTLTAHFPRITTGIDWQNSQFQYKPNTQPADSLHDLKAIIALSLELLSEGLGAGSEKYDMMAKQLEWLPVGLCLCAKKKLICSWVPINLTNPVLPLRVEFV